jgi:heme exporter protein D
MIPDLGKYAVEVLAAYGASIALLVGVIVVSLRRSRKVRAQLAEVEVRRERSS